MRTCRRGKIQMAVLLMLISLGLGQNAVAQTESPPIVVAEDPSPLVVAEEPPPLVVAEEPPPLVVAEEPPPMMSKPMGNIEDVGNHDVRQCAPDGVALGGFDAISYRNDTGPVAGLADFSVEYDGLRYRFENAQNAEQFASNPEAYVPRYGGWCAVTLALGRLTCPDFTSYKIENGELLLFEVTGFTNGRSLWDTDAVGFRVKADSNYLQLNDAP